MRPEAAHAPDVCRLAGCPLRPLLAQAHARELHARAAQTTTAPGPTARMTTIAAVPAPGRSARCWTAVGRMSGSRSAASEARLAVRRSSRPSTGHPDSRRRTAWDTRGVAAAEGLADAGLAGAAVRNR